MSWLADLGVEISMNFEVVGVVVLVVFACVHVTELGVYKELSDPVTVNNLVAENRKRNHEHQMRCLKNGILWSFLIFHLVKISADPSVNISNGLHLSGMFVWNGLLVYLDLKDLTLNKDDQGGTPRNCFRLFRGNNADKTA
jgi:hypothetical protein